MKMGLEKNGLQELVKEMEETMKQLDNDGSGLIDYSEFLAATMSRKVYLQYDYLWQVHNVFIEKITESGRRASVVVGYFCVRMVGDIARLLGPCRNRWTISV